MRSKKMYNVKSMDSNEYIDDGEILISIDEAKKHANKKITIDKILDKARTCKGLSHREAAVLLEVDDDETLEKMYKVAREVKETIYGKRIVLFAPLYLSSYCVNNCKYCGYRCANKIGRHQLTQVELREEIKALEAMGHKRLLLEAGEDDEKCPIEYILECIKTIYDEKFEHGAIRRVNVDIAATTVENYKKLKEAGIGTYILFQETYHKPTYLKLHSGPKQNYEWHTEAMDRAMQGGKIDDVGIGPLYGLYEYHYETVALLMHAEHMEAVSGVGPHTISFPRLLPAEGVNYDDFPYLVNNRDFKKVVATIRLAVPYTGMILSTRESVDTRKELLETGISQMSAGSCVGVGGYATRKTTDKNGVEEKPQFNLADHRKPIDVIKALVKDGYVPSYCTACYREGRTGDRFMPLAKSGQISNCCLPNALLTFEEYLRDYADDELKETGQKMIDEEIQNVPNEKRRAKAIDYLDRIRNGENDLRF
jgi:2-iminoacetate synthase